MITSHRRDRIPSPGPWAADAACLHADPDLWFPAPGDHRTLAAAVAVCAGCPVQSECLAFALRWRIDHGVWGGLGELDRRRLRRRHLVAP